MIRSHAEALTDRIDNIHPEQIVAAVEELAAMGVKARKTRLDAVNGCPASRAFDTASWGTGEHPLGGGAVGGAQEPDTYQGPPPAGGWLRIVLETVSMPSQCFVKRNRGR